MANVLVGTAHRSMPYRCRPCRRYFSVKTGTVMEDSKLGCQTWAVAIYLLTTGLKGQSAMKLHRDLGITQKTAWHLAHRIRRSWAGGAPAFSGPVETDETFIGGRMHNMSKARRATLQAEDSSGKTIVVGAKDRGTNEVAAAVVPDTARTTLRGFLRRQVKPGAVLYTDEHAAYTGIPDFRHTIVRHSVKEYVRWQAHTNGMESFWSMPKRGYVGTYHRMSTKHLGRYVDEFAGRHNARNKDTADQMATMASGLVGKRLPYADLVA